MIKVLEAILSTCFISGTILMISTDTMIHVIAFTLFTIGNSIGAYVTYKKKLYIVSAQSLVMNIFTILGIYNRLF